MNFEQRFQKKFRVAGDCWLWTAAKAGGKNADYGVIRKDGKQQYAHRAAYEFFVGEIPQGMQIDHLCRKRDCVNPKHLEMVTQRENLLRGTGSTALNAAKTHCKRGHKFTRSNTNTKSKWRRCQKCIDSYRERSKAR